MIKKKRHRDGSISTSSERMPQGTTIEQAVEKLSVSYREYEGKRPTISVRRGSCKTLTESFSRTSASQVYNITQIFHPP